MSTLKGKVALVTGASKGIGAAIAQHLAAAGATVFVNFATSKTDADHVVESITKAGGKAVAIQGDFSKADDIARNFAAIKDAHGKLDVLVNNAGVYAFGPVDEVTATEFHRQFDLNVLGLLLSTQAALKLMGEGGSIINVGSVVGSMPPAGTSVYSATKAAVDSLTVTWSKELGARKIRVNSLNPGLVETHGTLANGIATGDAREHIAGNTPLGRIGQPDDIGPVAVFLASDASAWVNGQKLLVSGGATS
jgi:3-oxoacyl-[acyl-carrier protein] reductase